VFSLGFVPVLLFGKLVLFFLTFTCLLDFILLPFFIYIGVILLVVSELLFSGIVIRVFRIYYKEGTYDYSLRDKTAFRWMLVCTLYTPLRKILEIISVGNLKHVYLRLLGMKIGKNSLLGGTIKDPCVTEIGENVTMGEYAIIYGHIHDYSKNTITIKKVKVKNDCVIGAGAIVMPGVTMEENSKLGAGGMAPKDHILKKGTTYGGIPAKEINKNRKKK
jgi:acetyltransferase-like isoleucine patch superfamily enzyme